ncbi:uncharacterized protein BXZ73DRAFT_91853 [Epithele typhae]|uniref:uncharacterized protein n=1 Tax=Epithele typhae TaxID=378194 RepID=UPI002008E752|nr:uncharacterized protein BXZ73DRAFT_91853 [Epithele typhae]KAH9921250.1 hypothetical protein BXZ73DRAFT_91853 [Epithele typhae]
MPAARSALIRRRRSSVAAGLTQVKPGNYGINSSLSPRALTFAPNVTPGTYVETDDDLDQSSISPESASTLFPPTEPTAPTRRRLPPGKRLSQGYIPRPPNAFMLFRANFVRQKHVPGSIETNHASLSKIIGNCWRALPLEEKRIWEIEAKKAKIAHRERYPNYRFRPVHNKNKKAAKPPVPPGEEERCEVVAQFLLEGKKGHELAEAVHRHELARALESRPHSAFDSPAFPSPPPPYDFTAAEPSTQVPLYMQRRPSSVPPPSSMWHGSNPISIPSLPFFAQPTPQPAFGLAHPGFGGSAHGSRAASPVGNIARQQRTLLGLRRASSAQPVPSERMWDTSTLDPHGYAPPMPAPWQLQPEWSPLPDVTDASIFQPGWANAFADVPADHAMHHQAVFDPAYAPVAPDAADPHALHLHIGPLDGFAFAPGPPSTGTDCFSAGTPYDAVPPHAQWATPGESGPPSTISGSPARSDASLPYAQQQQQFQPPPGPPPMQQHQQLCAPQPQHAYGAWAHELEQAKMAEGGEGMPPMDAGAFEYVDVAGAYDVYGLEMEMGGGMPEYGYCAPEQVY